VNLHIECARELAAFLHPKIKPHALFEFDSAN
jgi:hypothetical protein